MTGGRGKQARKGCLTKIDYVEPYGYGKRARVGSCRKGKGVITIYSNWL